MERLVACLERIGNAIAIACCLLLALTAIADVIGRPFGVPILLLSEVGIYLAIAVLYFPLAEVSRRRMHIQADFFDMMFSERTRMCLRVFVINTSFLIYVAVLLWLSTRLAMDSIRDGTRAPSFLMIQIGWPQLVIVAGLVLLCLRLVIELVRDFRTFTQGADRRQ